MLTASGTHIVRLTGVRAIMRDIAKALASSPDSPLINLSAGNPVIIPHMRDLWAAYLAELQSRQDELAALLGRYGETKGHGPFVEAVCDFFNSNYGTAFRSENVLVTPGSQSIFFYAANLFAGINAKGERRPLLLPCVPDYTGYGGVSLHDVPVLAFSPRITLLENHEFRYELDPAVLARDWRARAGTAFVSRPSNPSGRVISEMELRRLSDAVGDIPFFIDNAYGEPFPSVNFVDSRPVFSSRFVNTFSFSKVGLPGERIGIALGPPDIIEPLQSMQSNACIHSSKLGQAIATLAIRSGSLHAACVDHIRAHYRRMFTFSKQVMSRHLQGIEWFAHVPEGGMFIWLYLPNLTMTDLEVYDRLKQRHVAVVPGNVFFPGVDDAWVHKHQCLRISLTCTEGDFEEGIRRLAALLRTRQ